MPTVRQNLLYGFALAVLLLASVAIYVTGHGGKTPVGRAPFRVPDSPPATPEAPPAFPDITLKSDSGRVAVIMYHNVVKERRVWFDCTVDEFQKDLDEIAADGFTVLSLDQLYDHLTKGVPVPAKSIVLTFDDNYQGVHDNAIPLLRQRKWPAAVFVHTAYVGSKTGYPKMTWDELEELHREGLITIGAHTVTHPMNLKDLPLDRQRKELQDSKETLESHLGCQIPYMAYPDGSNDQDTQEIAKELGYKMSFTMEPTPAEGSPNILTVGRYEGKKFDKALQDEMDEIDDAPVAVADIPLAKPAPVSCEAGEYDNIKLVLLKGGTAESVLSSGREMVGDFVAENNAVAGINGTFFVMAAIASDDNRLIGPSRAEKPGDFMPDSDPYRLTKLVDRPMVVWGPTRFAVLPFEPGSMNQESSIKEFMPDYTDAFLAGAWLVHDGVPRTEDQMRNYSSQDIGDPRKRVFFGVTKDGQFLCGASQGSITSEMLAKAAVAAGVYEAVLLDSGFSASIVFNGKILVTGHSAIDNPSRPVPHAIVFVGEKGTENIGDLKTMPAVVATKAPPGSLDEEEAQQPKPARHHRRHRRRHDSNPT
ncbi:MAG TPA: polysaccharide deacetylase family protein [Fimbriimonadaceae bacterium]|nr:polysaccharide deacetylase family protein [Fimbriimonadaceae bacterium]